MTTPVPKKKKMKMDDSTKYDSKILCSLDWNFERMLAFTKLGDISAGTNLVHHFTN